METPSLDWIADPTAWLGLLTLVALEIVLGIDNLVFIAILADKLPPAQRERARVVGLSLALVMRLVLLAGISWLVTLRAPLIAPFDFEMSGRDLILVGGGLFLLLKATIELHDRLEGAHAKAGGPKIYAGFWGVIAQIVVLDAIFSLDSVITAVGMVDELAIMMIAVIVAVGVMMAASRPLMRLVTAHPTLVVLCLGFLLMIGFSLVLEGFHVNVPKGYLYAAIGFSVLVEGFNQLAQRNRRRHVGRRVDSRARMAEAVLRLLGTEHAGRESPTGEADALGAEIPAAGAGVFDSAEKDMVRAVFALAERPVRSIMTPRHEVEWLDVTAPGEATLARIRKAGHSRYPLARGRFQNLLGVAAAKDVIHDLMRDGAIDTDRPLPQPLFVHERMKVLRLVERIRSSRLHFAVVVDEYGSIQGVVTTTDLLEAIAGELPEHGEDPSVAERLSDGSWLFDGDTDVRRASDLLGVNLTGKQEYSTLAGFVLWELGHLPRPGEILKRHGLRFEVTDIRDRRIERIVVRTKEPADLRAGI